VQAKTSFPLIFALHLFAILVASAHAQEMAELRYDKGNPLVTDYFVDPVNGSDSRDGLSSGNAFRTLTQAWNTIPQGSNLGTGFRINILPGTLAESAIPNYLESRYGTFNAPIIFRANGGRGTVTLAGDLNVFDTRYLYLEDLVINPSPAGDAFHCERCDHILIRNSELSGGNRAAHETIKINQSSYIYIEDSNIHGADDNAIDFVAVQYGHIARNLIHNAQDWCAYAKGGSAYLRVEGNRIFNCGTGGFTAGQGTGFEFMTSPWIHYEAYDIKVINNVIHDTEGAGLGVNGGYNILLAHNTLYRVGSRSHTIEVVFGLRSCDGNASACQANINLGGWGTASVGQDVSAPIGDRNISIFNNVIYNPPEFSTGGQIFALYGPQTALAGSNVPGPVVVDDNLRIQGNYISSGPEFTNLGVDGGGCQPSNPTCNETQLIADNTITSTAPQFINAAGGDFRPLAGGNLLTAVTATIPAFPGGDRATPPLAPAGNLVNTVDRDRSEAPRTATTPPGAYASPTSEVDPPGGDDNVDVDRPPVIGRLTCSPTKVRVKKATKCRVSVSDDRGVRSVRMRAGSLSFTLRRSGSVYRGDAKFKKKGKYTLVATVTDSGNQSRSARGVKITVTK